MLIAEVSEIERPGEDGKRLKREEGSSMDDSDDAWAEAVAAVMSPDDLE